MTSPDCRCPVLLAAAEIERMLELGLELERYGSGKVRPILIGRLRQMYNCRGPRNGECPWDKAVAFMATPNAREEVPRVGRIGRGDVPGQWL